MAWYGWVRRESRVGSRRVATRKATPVLVQLDYRMRHFGVVRALELDAESSTRTLGGSEVGRAVGPRRVELTRHALADGARAGAVQHPIADLGADPSLCDVRLDVEPEHGRASKRQIPARDPWMPLGVRVGPLKIRQRAVPHRRSG